MLGCFRIGPGEQDHLVGKAPQRRPDLVPIDDPLVAIADGTRLQRGQITARRRLTETLTPDFVGTQNFRDITFFLRLGTIGQNHRPGPGQTDQIDQKGNSGASHLLAHDALVARRSSTAAIGSGPLDPDKTGIIDPGLPISQIRKLLVAIHKEHSLRQGKGRCRRPVILHPGTHLLPIFAQICRVFRC